MADDSKKAKCDKCGIVFWVDRHHIWPKAIFNGRGPQAKLCPNCHRDYHEQLGRDPLKNPDPDFHEAFFNKWLVGALTLLMGGLIYWLA